VNALSRACTLMLKRSAAITGHRGDTEESARNPVQAPQNGRTGMPGGGMRCCLKRESLHLLQTVVRQVRCGGRCVVGSGGSVGVCRGGVRQAKLTRRSVHVCRCGRVGGVDV